MGRTKRDFMDHRMIKLARKVGIEPDEEFIQQMKKTQAEWEEKNLQENQNFYTRVWKYFHNLHTRKSRNNTMNGRET